MIHGENGKHNVDAKFSEYRLLIVNELERLSNCYSNLDEKQNELKLEIKDVKSCLLQEINSLKNDLKTQKLIRNTKDNIKASILPTVISLVTVGIAILSFYFKFIKPAMAIIGVDSPAP